MDLTITTPSLVIKSADEFETREDFLAYYEAYRAELAAAIHTAFIPWITESSTQAVLALSLLTDAVSQLSELYRAKLDEFYLESKLLAEEVPTND